MAWDKKAVAGDGITGRMATKVAMAGMAAMAVKRRKANHGEPRQKRR
jgi:hypothetical protein